MNTEASKEGDVTHYYEQLVTRHVDKATGKEYSFPYQANKEHMKMQVPKGDYKIRVTGLDTENYFATLLQIM